MSTAEIARRTTLFFAAAVLLVAALAYIAGGSRTVTDTLPARLSDKEFWTMVNDFSEAGGYFRSDNFLSNEALYQRVIPVLRKNLQTGGVYLGVGRSRISRTSWRSSRRWHSLWIFDGRTCSSI